jgi:hypothetical protein
MLPVVFCPNNYGCNQAGSRLPPRCRQLPAGGKTEGFVIKILTMISPALSARICAIGFALRNYPPRQNRIFAPKIEILTYFATDLTPGAYTLTARFIGNDTPETVLKWRRTASGRRWDHGQDRAECRWQRDICWLRGRDPAFNTWQDTSGSGAENHVGSAPASPAILPRAWHQKIHRKRRRSNAP